MGADEQAKFYVSDHRGILGSAIVRALKQQGHHNFDLLSRDDLEIV
jgi:nucleoside-diphosphate-sugar epimerase